MHILPLPVEIEDYIILLTDLDTALLLNNKYASKKLYIPNKHTYSHAIENDNVILLEFLLENGINIHKVIDCYLPPLHLACSHESIKIFKFLLENGIDINQKCNSNGDNILQYAIKANNLEISKLVLNIPKLDINSQNKYLCTALHHAIYYQNLEIAKLLINKNINVNLKDIRGHIALDSPYIQKIRHIVLDSPYIQKIRVKQFVYLKK